MFRWNNENFSQYNAIVDNKHDIQKSSFVHFKKQEINNSFKILLVHLESTSAFVFQTQKVRIIDFDICVSIYKIVHIIIVLVIWNHMCAV